ncbi:MAG: sulfatase-like hydrolase/transferase [Spirochaetaceae bacterium]
MERKNVLLITSDQQRWDTLGVYNDRIKTPNLDRLSQNGITFDRAYTVNPVCTPSRCSMLTGHYPSRHGCYTIGTNLPEDYPTVPGVLNENGYSTALIGKAHFQSCLDENSFEAAPNIFNKEYFDSWQGPYYGFQKAKLVIGHSSEKHASGMHYGAWLKNKGINTDDYFGNHDYSGFGTWNLPEELHNSKWTADETLETIDEFKKKGTPFFIWSSFQDPHNPCVVPEPWASMYKAEDMPYYKQEMGEMDDKPALYKNIITDGNFGGSEDFGEKPWHCVRNSKTLDMDEKKSRDIMTKYYAMVSLMDHHIGRIIDKLEDEGLIDNTIIIFTSDHGDYMGNHGLWWKGLPAYDDALRIPFIVSYPECETKGKHSKAFQSNLDVASVILAEAGCSSEPLIQGIDQRDSWINSNKNSRDWVQVEFRPTESDFMQKTFLYEHYKMVVYTRDYGELYDMQKDPNQYNNLWNNEDYKVDKDRVIMKYIGAEMEKDGTLRVRTAPA